MTSRLRANSMEIGNLITLLTLLLTIILGISDIKRRRAEASKMESESHLSEANADTQIMAQIKQASIDLMTQLKLDNNDLRLENDELKEKVSYYRRILKTSGISFAEFESRKLRK